jgi:hypothetical protein
MGAAASKAMSYSSSRVPSTSTYISKEACSGIQTEIGMDDDEERKDRTRAHVIVGAQSTQR